MQYEHVSESGLQADCDVGSVALGAVRCLSRPQYEVSALHVIASRNYAGVCCCSRLNKYCDAYESTVVSRCPQWQSSASESRQHSVER